MANITNIPPVNGKNLKEVIDNINNNFSAIWSQQIWKGDPGEGYTEKDLTLWSGDVDTGITIVSPDVIRCLFTDGTDDDYDTVISWAADEPNKFISLGIPHIWSLYPGNPLWYVQPPKCYNYFRETTGRGRDWSCMVAVAGRDGDKDIYKRYDIVPQLYRDETSGDYCWRINGVETDIPASTNPDADATSYARMYLIRKTGETYEYMQATKGNVTWVDIDGLDIQPSINDIAWMVEKDDVTMGEKTDSAMVLKVCKYDGYDWVPATVDKTGNNFFLSYDDAMMVYVWNQVYRMFGDAYSDSLTANEAHSLCFPSKDANGDDLGYTHMITSKYNDLEDTTVGESYDLLVQAPKPKGSEKVKSHLVVSGYDNIYTEPIADGEFDEDSRLVKYGELKNRERYINIDIEDARKLDETTAIDGALYKIDRCYWKGSHTQYTNSVLKMINNSYAYTNTEYIRYVYLRCHIIKKNGSPDRIEWETSGIGELNDMPISGKGIPIRLYKVKFIFDDNISYPYDDYDKGSVYIGDNPESETEKIDNKKFGAIVWMKDDVYGNECDWDFIMHNTFTIMRKDVLYLAIPFIYDDWKLLYDPEVTPVYYDNYAKWATVEGTETHIVAPFRNNILTSYTGESINAEYNERYGIIPYSMNVDKPENYDYHTTAKLITIISESENVYLDALVYDNTFKSCRNILIIHDATSENVYVCNNNIYNSQIAVFTESFDGNSINNSIVVLGDTISEFSAIYGYTSKDKIYSTPCNFNNNEIENSIFRGIHYIYAGDGTVVYSTTGDVTKIYGIDMVNGKTYRNIYNIECNNCRIYNINVTEKNIDLEFDNISILSRLDINESPFLILCGDYNTAETQKEISNIKNCSLRNIDIHGILGIPSTLGDLNHMYIHLYYDYNLDLKEYTNGYVIGVYTKDEKSNVITAHNYNDLYVSTFSQYCWPRISGLSLLTSGDLDKYTQSINGYRIPVCSTNLLKSLHDIVYTDPS